MQSTRTLTHCLTSAMLSLVILLSACGPTTSPKPTSEEPASPAATAPPTATQPPTATKPPSFTATHEATATIVPTATSTIAATATTAPTLGPALMDSLTAWCLPDGAPLSDADDPTNPPEYARLGEMVNGALEIRNLPVVACIFIYTFNQPPPDGLNLEIYELNQQAPWWNADLLPVAANPNAAAVLLRHTYIVAPPLWDVSFEFAVKDSSGSVLRRDLVNLHRWVPALCWNGLKPHPITLRCALPQDLHPWDAGYGTPMPTFPPSED